jgi:hypothetical protein
MLVWDGVGNGRNGLRMSEKGTEKDNLQSNRKPYFAFELIQGLHRLRFRHF